MFYSTDAGHEGLWRVGLARNVVFFPYSLWVSKARKVSFQKRELWRISCLRCRQNLHRAVAREQLPKSSKIGMIGTLFEVELGKICTALWRESDSEVDIVKNWQVRSTFGS